MYGTLFYPPVSKYVYIISKLVGGRSSTRQWAHARFSTSFLEWLVMFSTSYLLLLTSSNSLQVAHAHYNFLEWLVVSCGLTGALAALVKTVLEQVRSRR